MVQSQLEYATSSFSIVLPGAKRRNNSTRVLCKPPQGGPQAQYTRSRCCSGGGRHCCCCRPQSSNGSCGRIASTITRAQGCCCCQLWVCRNISRNRLTATALRQQHRQRNHSCNEHAHHNSKHNLYCPSPLGLCSCHNMTWRTTGT